MQCLVAALGDATGRAHHDGNPRDARHFLRHMGRDALDIMLLNPVLQELGRHGKLQLVTRTTREFKALEPARKHILAEFSTQATLHAIPGEGEGRQLAACAGSSVPVVAAIFGCLEHSLLHCLCAGLSGKRHLISDFKRNPAGRV